MSIDKKEAIEKISEILKKIDSLYKEAEEIASKAEVAFYTEGPEYGMGGWFDPYEGEWQSSSTSGC